MKAEIASLIERMEQGGDWKSFRDEIVELHAKATTQEEYVALLEAFTVLADQAEVEFDAKTYAELLPLMKGDYLLLLNKETMEDGLINPVLLDRVTQREVEAGRLDAFDSFRQFATDAALLGDSAEITAHRSRHGDYFCYGMVSAAIAAVALIQIKASPLWLILAALLIGWFMNERERMRIKAEIQTRRQAPL